jgi:hypothetical protein
MIRFLGIAATAMAMISVEPVSAQTFSTTGGVYTFSGSGVAIRKGLGSPLNCFMSVDITNDGMGNITADNIVFSGSFGFCDAGFVAANVPWTVTVSGSTVTFHNVYIQTMFPGGDCEGDLVASFSQTGVIEELSFDTGFTTPSTLHEVSPGTGSCSLAGVLSWP